MFPPAPRRGCASSTATPLRARSRAAADPRKRLHQVAGVIGVSPDAEPEDDLTLLPVGQIEGNLDRGAGIQGGPHLAGKPRPGHRGRSCAACRCVPGIQSGRRLRSGSHRPRRRRQSGRRTPCCRGSARRARRFRVNFGDHVHGRFRPQISQHPFHIPGGGEPARSA